MRILFIANCEGLYGANRSMVELAIELKKLGQEIFFFFPQGNISKERYLLRKYLNDNGFIYAFLDYMPSVHYGKWQRVNERIIHNIINRNCLFQMKEFVEKWQINIIHTNSLTHLIGASLSRKTLKPHVWHIREALKEDYNLYYDSKIQYRYALWNTKQVICISNYIKKLHKNILFGANVISIKDGFDIDKYILNKVYQRQKNIYNLIICGCIQEGKGQLDAVKAVNYLVHKYHFKNIHLRIVGNGTELYLKKIKEYIIENSLQNFVTIIPFQQDLRELRRISDIALMCSRNEALGRVTIESMLSENLVIGANSAGTKEIIKDGVNGYLYKSENAYALCEKIYNVISHWEMQEKIIKNAKKYAVHNYEVNRYAKKILAVYQKIQD